MKEREVSASPFRLIKYFFLAIASITFFVLLKESYGSWFINGFIFALDSPEAFIFFIIILFSYYKFGVEVWRLRLYIIDQTPQFLSVILGFILVIISIYCLSEFSMIFSLYIVRHFGLDPMQGYVP
jgi:hypothetical protein